MAAPIGVSDEEIIRAGQGLAAFGRKVTGWSLRTEVGSGKPERLAEVWKSYLATQEAAPDLSPPPPPLPSVLEEQSSAMRERVSSDLASLFVSAWQTAERVASERVQGEAAAVREAMAGVASDLEAASKTLDKVEAEREAMFAEVNRLVAETVSLRDSIMAADGQAAVQRGRAEAAEAERDRLAADLAEARRVVTVCEARADRAETDAREATTRAKASDKLVRESETARAGADARAAAASDRAERAEALVRERDAELHAAAEERGRLLHRVERAEAELAAAVAAAAKSPAKARGRKPKVVAVPLAS